MTVLVTGAAGMIGSLLVKALEEAGYDTVGVDRRPADTVRCVLDLADEAALGELMQSMQIHRVIHLAALAHGAGEKDLSAERYHHINVTCAEHVFRAAGQRPVLFSSTVDVYGFTKAPVTPQTPPHPVTPYGKSKALAEQRCSALCPQYTIFRFSPVYTPTVKRDIQKRYYLKYPSVAYRIGLGSEYEVLSVERAVEAMVRWCGEEPQNEIKILKDPENLRTRDAIRAEKAAGRAKLVLWFPTWLVRCGYWVLRTFTGENPCTYLLSKAVHPLRSEEL